MTELGRSGSIRGAVAAFGLIALAFGTARVSAAQGIDQRLRASRGYSGSTEGFADPSGRAFTFCRIAYRQVRTEPLGQGWRTDWPDADRNLMLRLSQLTRTPMRTNPRGRPEHLVVEFTDDDLFQCPFTFMSDVGTMAFDSEEADRLREYLLRGGFLWVDDFWGTRAWNSWVREIRKVLPEDEYPIEDVPPGSTIFNALYVVYDVPQVPSIQHWRRAGRGFVDIGAGLRQCYSAPERDPGRAGAYHRADVAQHRHRRWLGERGGGRRVLLPVLPQGLRARDQHRPIRADSLTPGPAHGGPHIRLTHRHRTSLTARPSTPGLTYAGPGDAGSTARSKVCPRLGV